MSTFEPGRRAQKSFYHRVPLRARVAGRGEAVKKKNGESTEKNQVSRTKVTLRVTLYSVIVPFSTLQRKSETFMPAMPLKVLEALLRPICMAWSKLFGDPEMISVTRALLP